MLRLSAGEFTSASRNAEEVADEAKLFYVAATRATQRLVVTVAGDGAFAKALAA